MEDRLLKAYAEVDEVLSYMEEQYVEKVPKKLRKLFKNKRLNGYNPGINPKIPLYEQNLQKETYSFLAVLNFNYWCEDEKERQKLISLYLENDRKKEIELRDKYNPDNLFKNKQLKKEEIKKENKKENNTSLIEYRKKNLLKRFLNKIVRLFKKN